MMDGRKRINQKRSIWIIYQRSVNYKNWQNGSFMLVIRITRNGLATSNYLLLRNLDWTRLLVTRQEL